MISKHDQPPIHKIGKRGQAIKLHRELIYDMIFRVSRGERYVFAPGVHITFACGCTKDDKVFISNLLKKKGKK